ncbi:MAG TPA: geranylgeranyl reductase family protein [Syntrophales bacterium]|nr:geranylgeranyl reductase family protein [Syntrophales bacterium]HQB29281.1 geranylgeranyl reductase family protein [Syntrophales bacterium]HQN77159.1 geranylgeranyl reductase family protein [Syntrophales bacterium]HQQ25974.1 geranylgeranyl reductase family protein [Syntrophales bacterium]
MMDHFDVAVVGAGPAGGYCAYLLARKGLSVLLLEKDRLTRYKACGGGIPSKVVSNIEFDVSEALEVRTEGAYIAYDIDDFITIAPENSVGWMVMRDRFDSLIVNEAGKKGVTVLEGTEMRGIEETPSRCTVRTNHGSFHASFVVGADGANSTVAKIIDHSRSIRKGIAISAEIYVPDKKFEKQGPYSTFDFGVVPKGYAWIFPKSDHLSIGMYSMLWSMPDIRKRLFDYIEKNPILRDYEKISVHGHPIPLGRSRKSYGSNRIYLVGDAGGITDPFFGEGIYFAIESAKIAAKSIIDRLVEYGSIKTYTKDINEKLGRDLDYSYLMARFFYYNLRLSFSHIVRNTHINSIFTKLIRGDIGHKQCFYRSMVRLVTCLSKG